MSCGYRDLTRPCSLPRVLECLTGRLVNRAVMVRSMTNVSSILGESERRAVRRRPVARAIEFEQDSRPEWAADEFLDRAETEHPDQSEHRAQARLVTSVLQEAQVGVSDARPRGEGISLPSLALSQLDDPVPNVSRDYSRVVSGAWRPSRSITRHDRPVWQTTSMDFNRENSRVCRGRWIDAADATPSGPGGFQSGSGLSGERIPGLRKDVVMSVPPPGAQHRVRRRTGRWSR